MMSAVSASAVPAVEPASAAPRSLARATVCSNGTDEIDSASRRTNSPRVSCRSPSGPGTASKCCSASTPNAWTAPQDAAQRRIEETLDPAPEHGTGGRHNGSESNAPTSDDEAE